MSSKYLLDITLTTEKIGLLTAFASNLLLLYLLITKATSSYGSYKFLMIYFTIIEMTYSILNVSSSMVAHSSNTSYVVFRPYNKQIGRKICPALLVDFCGIYFALLILLAIHFVYRYIVVCKSQYTYLFERWKLVIWMALPLVIGTFQATLKYFAFAETPYLTELLREEFKTTYNITMESICYNGPNYYICDKNGECDFNLTAWFAMAFIGNSMTMALCLMAFCGVSICIQLSRNKSDASDRTIRLQKQLMNALIIQSVIPICLMYIPIALLFLSPMVGIGIGPYGNIVMATIAIYPPIDQFAIILVIQDFRQAVKNIFCGEKYLIKSVRLSFGRLQSKVSTISS